MIAYKKWVTVLWRGERTSNPDPGDAYMDPDTFNIYVYANSVDGWVSVDRCGNPLVMEELKREELHANFPRLGELWEEYHLMKKLYAGDIPREYHG